MSATIITQPAEIAVGASQQDTTVCSSSDPFPALDVAQVFARIKDHNRKACEGILHIVEAGKLLTLLKRKLPHGQFIKMATKETGLSRSTISRYMQIASNGAHVGHLKSGRNALELITELTTRKERTVSRKAAPVILDAEMVEPPPSPRSSAPSPRTSPTPDIIEAEIVEPEAAQEMISVESLTGTSGKTRSRVRAVTGAAEDFDPEDELPEPLTDAIDRLIFILLTHKCSQEYIHGLCEGVLLTEKHNKKEGVKP